MREGPRKSEAELRRSLGLLEVLDHHSDIKIRRNHERAKRKPDAAEEDCRR